MAFEPLRGNGGRMADLIAPRLIVMAWELTRSCNLLCAHCRASADDVHYDGELSTRECFGVIDNILTVGNPVLILTGGEPLARSDFFEIAGYAAEKGLIVAVGSNGTLITPEAAAKLKNTPVFRVSVSLDFPEAVLQDEFRGAKGAYESAMAGIRNLRAAGVPVQVNSTITKRNVHHLDRLLSLAVDEGAAAFHPFMLVPTGRGRGLRDEELSPQEYESALNWMYDRQKALGDRIFFKPTDAPHYMRIIAQRRRVGNGDGASEAVVPDSVKRRHTINTITRGCMAGTGFCFISHRGRVQGCGYLDVSAGDLREQTFSDVWANSRLFTDLRNISLMKGKCGACEYKRMCGGCRARAYEATGDYMEAEPYCVYEPRSAVETSCGGRQARGG